MTQATSIAQQYRSAPRVIEATTEAARTGAANMSSRWRTLIAVPLVIAPVAPLLDVASELLAAAQALLRVNDECVAAVQRGADPYPLGERFSGTLPALRDAVAKATGNTAPVEAGDPQ